MSVCMLSRHMQGWDWGGQGRAVCSSSRMFPLCLGKGQPFAHHLHVCWHEARCQLLAFLLISLQALRL